MSAAAQQKAAEPSMEEILASIRRIIADDQAPAAVPPPPAPAAVEPPAPAMDEADDVLELTSPQPASEPAGQPAWPEPVAVHAWAAASSAYAEPPRVEPEPEPVFVPPPPAPAAMPNPARMAAAMAPSMVEAMLANRPQDPQQIPPPRPLLSAQTDTAVAHAFNSLATTVLNSNARTLEDIVTDMLRPMIKQWLDDNLPGMVERLVRAEIERVSRGGR
jgi:hypothetical protein